MKILDYYKVYVEFKEEGEFIVNPSADTSIHCQAEPKWDDLSKSWMLIQDNGIISYIRADALKCIAWESKWKKPNT